MAGKDVEQQTKEENLRKAKAEADKAEAEARKAKKDAETPSVKSQPLEGQIAADAKSGYIATLAAYSAMAARADEIASDICVQPDLGDSPRLLVVDSLDFCSLDIQVIQLSPQLAYWEEALGSLVTTIVTTIEGIEKARDKKALPLVAFLTAGPTITAGLEALKGVVGLAADVIGFFRVDYDIRGQTISLSNAALQALVAARIIETNKKCSVFLPAFHRVKLDDKIAVIEALNRCILQKGTLKQKIADLRKLSPKPVTEGQETEEAKKLAGMLEEICKKAEQVIAEFLEFNKAITSPPQGGGYSALASAAIRQYVDLMHISHLLYLNVTSSGGEMVLGKGLFQSGKIGYIGGCAVTYVLAECSGKIVTANTMINHSTSRYSLSDNNLSAFNPR